MGAQMAATTDGAVAGAPTRGLAAGPRARAGARGRPAAGPDRLSVAIFTLAAFFAVLALMAWQLGPTGAPVRRTLVTVRRVYETRVLETIVPTPGRSTSSQSVSSSGTPYLGTAAPVTRSSPAR